MRRVALDPPRTLPPDAASIAVPVEADIARALPVRGVLPAPLPARERRRHLFHPRRGWLRRTERWVSHRLDVAVFPRIPGIARPYSSILERRLTLSEATLEIRDLPAGFDGATVLLVTDVHAGPFVEPQRLRETFRRLLTVRPDLILLGGDQITSRLSELTDHRRAFEELTAPLGVYAVLGNHEYYTGDPQGAARLLESYGVRVLHNASTELRRGDAVLSLAGVDDALIGTPDLDAALRHARPPVILLSHNPDLLFDAVRAGVAVMLSGHTHAGQVRIPGLPVIVRQSRYRLDEGRYRSGSTELVVSRGLGASGIPWRVCCPPEAVLLRLRGLRRSPA